MKNRSVFIAMMLLVAAPLLAQEPALLQSFVYDAVIPSQGIVEGGGLYVKYNDWDVSEMIFAVRGGWAFNEKMALYAQLAHVRIDDNFMDATNGLSDIGLFGRYQFSDNGKTQFAAGPFVTLPVGSEDVGQSNFNYGAFGAVRHKLNGGITLTGNLGIEFVEFTTWENGKEGTTHESGLMMGAGVIYPLSGGLVLMAEWSMRDKFDYAVLNGAIQYPLGPGALRAGVGFGVDDGAPDLLIAGGYAINIGR